MPVILEIVSGPQAGHRFEIPDGETLLVGRRPPSQLTIAGDELMSSVHFLLRADEDVCTIADRNSTNGTWVNNERVESARLQPGDRIRAGTTEFIVPAKEGKASFGSWTVTVPPGWAVAGGQGLKLSGEGIHSNVIFAEEDVSADLETQDYIASQRGVILQVLPESKVSDITLAQFPGTGEMLGVSISFRANTGDTASQRQFYIRRGNRIGILTTTTVEAEAARAQADFDGILASVRFEPAND